MKGEKQKRGEGLCDPQPQSSQVRLMRTLLVSADLTADENPATGGHRRFVPRAPAPGDFSRGCRPAYADNDPLDHCPGASALLDLNSGYGLDWKISLVPADAWRNVEVWLGAVVLLARRQSRQPGCFASGESQGIIRRGKFTFPCGCSRAFLGQKPSNFP